MKPETLEVLRALAAPSHLPPPGIGAGGLPHPS